MKTSMNRLQQSGPGATRGLLVILTIAALMLGGSASYGRGFYGGGYRGGYYGGGGRVAVAGPRGVAVAGPNGVAAVGRYGGVAAAGYRPVYRAPGYGAAMAAGGFLYAPGFPNGYVNFLPPSYSNVYYGGYNCYYSGGVYYRPVFYGGSTVYVVVQ